MYRFIVWAIFAAAPIFTTVAYTESCGDDDIWRCNDGSCISIDKKCDGKFDCPDESDETHPLCWKNYCDPSRFRCAYGACVDATAPCNGDEDCADGSDELLPRCRNNEKIVVRGEFTCFHDGEKILASSLCDGVKDCASGDDELLAYCGGLRCQPNQFQCAYGACVDPHSDCNEDLKWDCADGSDETDLLCNRTTVIVGSTTDCVNDLYGEWYSAPSGHSMNYGSCIQILYEAASETEPSVIIKPCDGFRCKNGVCMSDDLRCNGVAECPYGEDEEHCDSGKCSGKFTCGDGSCIKLNARCNGKTDCPDGSDETHAFCRNFTETCPEDKFRCTYGACVDEAAPCDGVQDCADGSDELLAKCRNETLIVNGEFTCRNGEKLAAEALCNGIEDCVDGSDETLASCADFKCSDADQFQCAYGACVHINSVCDADRNDTCADGSDEDDVLCNRPPSKKCVLPPYPEHGSYSVLVGRRSGLPGQTSSRHVVLSVECEDPYRLDGPDEARWSDGEWTVPVAQCKQFCELPRHHSVTYFCGDHVCNDWEPSGTEVRPKCINNYVPDIKGGQLSNMNCVFQTWDYIATCKLDISYEANGNNFTIFIGGKEVVVRVSGTDYAVSVEHDSKPIKTHNVAVRIGPNERVDDDPDFDKGVNGKTTAETNEVVPSLHFDSQYFESDQ